MIRPLARRSLSSSQAFAARCVSTSTGVSSPAPTAREHPRKGAQNYNPRNKPGPCRSPATHANVKKLRVTYDDFDKLTWGEYAAIPPEAKTPAKTSKSVSKQQTNLERKTAENQEETPKPDEPETYDIEEWWEKWYPIARAETEPPRPLARNSEGRIMYNPYGGSMVCWQTRETVDSFLKRTKNIRECFIRVANPYERPRWRMARKTFNKAGEERLRMFSDFMDFYGQGDEAEGKRDLGTIATERAEVMRNLTRLADACELRTGKWILEIPHDRLEDTWRKVVEATINNELGSEACLRRGGISKFRPNSHGDLIKVYTRNFRDKADAARVLLKLKQLGVLESWREYFYKSEAISHLNLYSHNRWGLKTSLVSIRCPCNSVTCPFRLHVVKLLWLDVTDILTKLCVRSTRRQSVGSFWRPWN
ncbi:hypothetical protein B0T20DRAFT_83560 [Sordaria brevicollis]|uniref:Uncharacterized protein n=1 Tax=Sordaria brevicollis TaxID=83679 RepID=A0AAE0U5F1_SORBR|nr:hypothetical protein B0T20DRAFT_83560 [Sordaria brevicollis]